MLYTKRQVCFIIREDLGMHERFFFSATKLKTLKLLCIRILKDITPHLLALSKSIKTKSAILVLSFNVSFSSNHRITQSDKT